jgi:anaerobic dimethyl sulfoxide reductase subunit B
MGQLAFWFDASTCIGCKACEIACKEKYNLPAGVRWRQVADYGGGEWTQQDGYVSHEGMYTYYVSSTCMHCEEPPCIPVCEPGSLYKRAEDGIVVNDMSKCTGCRLCEPTCPWDALHFDLQSGLVSKCDFCIDDIAVGKQPACIHICPQRCLDYGELDELQEKYGDLRAVEPLPDVPEHGPAMVVVPHKDSQKSGEGTGRVLNRYEDIVTSNARVSTRSDLRFPEELAGEIDYPAMLAGEMALCGLLAKALLSYADREWMQSLARDNVFSYIPFAANRPDVIAGQALLKSWSEMNESGLSDEDYEDLNTDYTQLFTTTFGQCYAPPWESVYCNENQLLFQEQTAQVREWYRRFNLESEQIYQEPDDHMGLELSFLAHLAASALDARLQGDEESFQALMDAQRQFLSEHTLIWAHHWCDRAISMARTDFYRGLVLLIRGALCELAAVLKIKVPNKLYTPYTKGAGAKLKKASNFN